jgi:hypothetical protein
MAGLRATSALDHKPGPPKLENPRGSPGNQIPIELGPADWASQEHRKDTFALGGAGILSLVIQLPTWGGRSGEAGFSYF